MNTTKRTGIIAPPVGHTFYITTIVDARRIGAETYPIPRVAHVECECGAKFDTAAELRMVHVQQMTHAQNFGIAMRIVAAAMILDAYGLLPQRRGAVQKPEFEAYRLVAVDALLEAGYSERVMSQRDERTAPKLATDLHMSAQRYRTTSRNRQSIAVIGGAA